MPPERMTVHQEPISAKRDWFQVKGGELFFEYAGNGDPVVFLHGFGLDSRMWNPQCEGLQSGYRILRYDLRGFGRSSTLPPSEYAHEGDLQALLSHLGVESAHIVGLSMGGRIALRFAAGYPQMVQSLVLADSALDGYSWSNDWQRRWQALCDLAKAEQLSEARRQYFEHPLFASARTNPACAAFLSSMIDDYSGSHWQGQDRPRMPSPPLAGRLMEIRIPSLVITGSRDLPDFLEIADVLFAGLPRARREVIEGSGHMVNLEAPAIFNEMLRGFWQSLSRT